MEGTDGIPRTTFAEGTWIAWHSLQRQKTHLLGHQIRAGQLSSWQTRPSHDKPILKSVASNTWGRKTESWDSHAQEPVRLSAPKVLKL